MMRMVKTISTLYGANHRSGRTDVGTDGETDGAVSSPLFPSLHLARIWSRTTRESPQERERGSDHVGAFPNFLVKGLIALPLPGRTDSSFSVDSSVILNQVYTFAATA